MRENAPLSSYDPIYVHTYTQKVQNSYTSSKYGHVWTQMKGLDELITILQTRTYWPAPISMICHRGVVKTISYILTSLVACHVMTHQPLHFIVFYGSTVITWNDDSSRRNLFFEDYPISASVFVFRGYNTTLFVTICLLYFSDMLWLERTTSPHLTSDMRPPNDISSH